MSRVVARLASLLLVVALGGAVLALGPRASADEYSDASLEAFVSAAIEISRRIETWRPLIEGTADEDERDALIEDAQADLARAIEETGGHQRGRVLRDLRGRARGRGAARPH